MPRISFFYGIVISMYFNDHSPPHFHAIYGEHEAKVSIETGLLIDGKIPSRARRLVKQWAILHRQELMDDWIRARAGEELVYDRPAAMSGRRFPRVVKAEVIGAFDVRLTFTDGLVREVNLLGYLRGPVFEPLLNPVRFAELRVDDELGTIVWPNGADIDPDVLYGSQQPDSAR